ncbi:MAG: hypothetical protein IAG10_30170 [Planctomycetaceae bacterium]|nr:hypothetical protein [Planctomycetaceae bacterium]
MNLHPMQMDLKGKNFRDWLKDYSNGSTVEQSELDAGRYYPRVWRTAPELETHGDPILRVEDTQEFDTFVNALEQIEGLCEDLLYVFRVVHPAMDGNLNAYGGAIRDVIILACTEVEAQWRGVLEAHSVTPEGNYYNTQDYVKLLPALKLNEYAVKSIRYPSLKAIAPFRGWAASDPTKSLNWYSAYNKVKHDREMAFSEASLIRAIEVVAGCVVMLAAQFGVQALERHHFKSLFEITERPKWEPKQWYYQPIPGEKWSGERCPI